jgi:hypothetical protein
MSASVDVDLSQTPILFLPDAAPSSRGSQKQKKDHDRGIVDAGCRHRLIHLDHSSGEVFTAATVAISSRGVSARLQEHSPCGGVILALTSTGTLHYVLLTAQGDEMRSTCLNVSLAHYYTPLVRCLSAVVLAAQPSDAGTQRCVIFLGVPGEVRRVGVVVRLLSRNLSIHVDQTPTRWALLREPYVQEVIPLCEGDDQGVAVLVVGGRSVWGLRTFPGDDVSPTANSTVSTNATLLFQCPLAVGTTFSYRASIGIVSLAFHSSLHCAVVLHRAPSPANFLPHALEVLSLRSPQVWLSPFLQEVGLWRKQQQRRTFVQLCDPQSYAVREGVLARVPTLHVYRRRIFLLQQIGQMSTTTPLQWSSSSSKRSAAASHLDDILGMGEAQRSFVAMLKRYAEARHAQRVSLYHASSPLGILGKANGTSSDGSAGPCALLIGSEGGVVPGFADGMGTILLVLHRSFAFSPSLSELLVARAIQEINDWDAAARAAENGQANSTSRQSPPSTEAVLRRLVASRVIQAYCDLQSAAPTPLTPSSSLLTELRSFAGTGDEFNSALLDAPAAAIACDTCGHDVQREFALTKLVPFAAQCNHCSGTVFLSPRLLKPLQVLPTTPTTTDTITSCTSCNMLDVARFPLCFLCGGRMA